MIRMTETVRAERANEQTSERTRTNERERTNANERTRTTDVTDAMRDAIDNGSAEEDEDAWKDLGLGGAR